MPVKINKKDNISRETKSIKSGEVQKQGTSLNLATTAKEINNCLPSKNDVSSVNKDKWDRRDRRDPCFIVQPLVEGSEETMNNKSEGDN